MRDYLGALVGHPTGTAPSAPPSTLRWIQGAPTTSQIGPYRGNIHFGETTPYCSIDLQITNTSSSPIPIPQVGLQLQAASQPNPSPYRLIDICSFVSQEECQLSQGAGDFCTVYGVQVQLAPGAAGDEFLTTPAGIDRDGSPCPALLVKPGVIYDLILNFGSAEALMYVGAIELKLETASGQRTLVLTQAPSTLAFAAANQFACYQLQGTAFTVEAQGTAALDDVGTDPQTGQNHACL